MSATDPLPLLNVFEVADDQGATRHLLAFIEPVRAGSSGIAPRSIVGEITPTAGGYDPRSLKLNPEFIEAFTDYMNEVQSVTPEIVAQARDLPSGWVYIIDPRHVEEPGVDPPADRPRRGLRRRRQRPGRPPILPVQREPRPDRPGARHVRPLHRPEVLRLAAPIQELSVVGCR